MLEEPAAATGDGRGLEPVEAKANPATAAPIPNTPTAAIAGSSTDRRGFANGAASSGTSTGGDATASSDRSGSEATTSAPAEERASPAAIHSRYSSAISAAVAPHSRANFSIVAYSGGTDSPRTYRCSVDVPTCNRRARTP